MIPLRIGYSTCPNDTYIFAALAEERIDAPLLFEPVLADVETLNQWALESRLEVTKLSFPALGRAIESYGLLNTGAALGFGCGPLLVARPGTDLARLADGLVAAPGELTTARMLLGLFLGQEPNCRQMVFSEIMPAVARGEADFGLIIHEGRFTYQQHGLVALQDLGQWWEGETGLPLPLGCIAVRRDLGPEMARSIDAAIRASLVSARTDPVAAQPYILQHAQEMDLPVVEQHIELYVNQYSLDLAGQGLEAIEILLGKARETGLIPETSLPLTAY